ncbi:MAG TPA: hypothetical protein VKA14_10230, partial [Gammaproteobacteria bacterium]|nr:hypothetical protein [Gammaproteobacteria bacterium]
ENFEDPSVWGSLRTTVSGNRNYQAADSVTRRGVTWDAYFDTLDYVTTEQRFHRLPGETDAEFAANAWGFTAITRRNTYEAFKGSSVRALYGVGGYIDTISGYTYDDSSGTYSPEAQLTMRVGGALYDFNGDNDIAYSTSFPNLSPRFFGVIDTAGFNDFAYITNVGYGVETTGGHTAYYGPIIWGDSFTIAPSASVVPLPPSGWLFLSALAALAGLGRLAAGRDRTLPRAHSIA